MNYSYPGPIHPWTDPAGRIEALCILELQQHIAEQYMHAREYWNENRKKCGDVAEFPEGAAYGPNEAQRVVESFYVDIGLLPRQRLRRPPLARVVKDPPNDGPALSISTHTSSSSLYSSVWRRYLPKTQSPKKIWSQVCRRSISMPMIRKLTSSSLVSFFTDIGRKPGVKLDAVPTSPKSPDGSDQSTSKRPSRGRTLSAPDKMVTIFQPPTEPIRSIDSVLALFSSPISSTTSSVNGTTPSRPRRNTVNDADTVAARARLAENRPPPSPAPPSRRQCAPPRMPTDEQRKERDETPFLTEEQEAALREWKETVALWDRRRKAIAKADAELYWYHFLWFFIVLNWSIISLSVIAVLQTIFKIGRLVSRL
ncbi:hypothetical protein IW261DRAFT_807873 [Armillaria novae-zelandiae]|uniref:Uncharacterized protein n=1 Tax=Armillaria novae-zelandiae TaxID=153914 RepID=A0AA39NV73_9AGAR|nr:hypothetical protein IW261DRAFT_807873 [Armillaria novae-zelandiae]